MNREGELANTVSPQHWLFRVLARPGLWLAAGVASTAVIAVTLLFLCDPARVPIYPVCQFHQWTHLDCPGCGSLRAMHALMHGNIGAALHLNFLLVLSLPAFGWLAFRFVERWVRGLPPLQIRPFWCWFYAGMWLLFGVLRNLPGPFFGSFAP